VLCHYRLLPACVIRGERVTRVQLRRSTPAFRTDECASVPSTASNAEAGIVSRPSRSEAKLLEFGSSLAPFSPSLSH